jgi:hypothetical protein
VNKFLKQQRAAVEVAQNESLADVDAQLRITYRVIPRFSVASPLSHAILTSELITPRTVAAFDATRGEVRLPSFILGNASVRVQIAILDNLQSFHILFIGKKFTDRKFF